MVVYFFSELPYEHAYFASAHTGKIYNFSFLDFGNGKSPKKRSKKFVAYSIIIVNINIL